MRRAGLLTQIIEILSPTNTKNEFGEIIQEYKVTYRTRAKVSNQSGNRTMENNEIFYMYNKTFQVRSYVPVKDRDLIRFKGNDYRILTIEDRKEEENDKIIYTELVNG